jgi:hypothetical protein
MTSTHVKANGSARLGALLWALGLTLLFGYFLLYLAHAAVLVRYPFDVDQGEGYDVNSGWLLAQRRPIYNDNSLYPYYSSNYPPVFSLLLAPIVASYGPLLGAGRLLSATAAVLTALLIGLIVLRRTGSGLAAATAGLLYVSSNYVYHVTPLARVNALATLFALAGVYCCSRVGRGWVVGAVVAFLLALYTKQTTIDAVGAGLLFLLLTRRRAGLVATLALGAIGTTILLALDWAHDGQFFVNVVLGNVNPFSVAQAFGYYRNFLELHGVLVVLAGWWAWRAFRRRAWGPFELYWAAALVLAVSVGKWGAGESYFLAPIAASCVLAGSTLAAGLRAAGRRPHLLRTAGVLVSLQAVLFVHGPLTDGIPLLRDRGVQAVSLARWPSERDLASGLALVTQLRQYESPVLAEDPSYVLAAGKEIVGNATHLRNLYHAGVWRPDNLVADLEARRYSWVVLDAELYPEPVLVAIGRYYYLFEEYPVYDTRQHVFAPGAQ